MPVPTTPIIPVIGGANISLKEFRRKIKALGYRVKTHVGGAFGTYYRHLEVLDKNGNFIVGSGANAYPAEIVKKHQKVFDLLREYRGRVFDEEGDKVLF